MQRALSIEEVINKLDIKIKNVCSSKDIIKRMKRQGTAIWYMYNKQKGLYPDDVRKKSYKSKKMGNFFGQTLIKRGK